MDPSIERLMYPGNNNWKLSSWNMVLDKIAVELNKSSEFIHQFTSSATNHERALLCFNNATVTKSIQEYQKICKSALGHGKKVLARASSLRLKGNEVFGMKQSWEALMLYTRALMFAPKGNEAPLLYGNRSAAFYKLKQYENAIEDIERAFSLGYARLKPEGKGKLLLRKAECLRRLGRNEEVKLLLESEQNEAPLANTPDGTRWNQLKSLSTIDNRTVTIREVNLSKFQDSETVIRALIKEGKFTAHERFFWLNRKVDLHFDEEKGFKLISNEKLEFGEVAAVGKPFVALFSYLKKDRHYLQDDNSLENDTRESTLCHYCFAACFNSFKHGQSAGRMATMRALEIQQLSSGPYRVFAPLPCTQCSNVIYCSEYCRTEAWNEFHQFECAQFAILTAGDLTIGLLALRMLYSAGSLEKIKQVANDWETVQDRLEMLKEPREYAFIYSMCLPEKRDLREDLRMAITACFLAKLAQMSGFVPNLPEDELFAVGILLRHQLQVKTRRLIECGRGDRKRGLISQVHGIHGLMKHSCNSNICIYDIASNCRVIQSNVKILYASRPIDADTELNPFYGVGIPMGKPPNSKRAIDSARHSMEYFKVFRLICKCARCLQERRDTLNPPNGAYYPVACSSCGSLMIRSEKGTLPTDGSFQCSSTTGCNLKMTRDQMNAVYSKVDQVVRLYGKALDSLPNRFFGSRSRHSQNMFSRLKESFNGTAVFLHGGSPFLAHLYDRFFELMFFQFQTVMLGPHFDEGDQREAFEEFLPASWKYLEKHVEVLEKRFGGSLEGNMTITSALIASFTVCALGDLEDQIEMATEDTPHLVKLFKRLQAAQKMIEFDRIITSPSP